jgi:oligopeptide transport system substrate-binding protein
MKLTAERFIIALITISAIFSSCGDGIRQGDQNLVFRYNEAADITSLDPAFARDQANTWAVNQLYNSLLQLNDSLVVEPCLARTWDVSADGKKYTFHLRQDVLFHDSPCFPEGKGRKLVAGDVLYSLQRIRDPKTASPGAWIFNYIDARSPFASPDDSTIIICLKQPFPPFLGILTMQYCSVVPHEAVTYYGTEFRRNPVGTGPFRFGMWKEGVKLVFTRNPHYFETENGDTLPYLQAVAISFLPDKQAAFLQFMNGKLDFMSGIDPAYKDELLTRDGELNPRYSGTINLMRQPYLNTEYLGIMVGDESKTGASNPLLNAKIRKAVNLSFDRKKMIRYLRNGIGIPGNYGIIPAGIPGFNNSKSMYDYDPVRAGELLAEAGFPGGRGLPPVTLTSTSDYLDICKYIQFQVAEEGIQLNIEISPPAAVKEMKAQAKLPFFRASWIADYPDAESYLSLFLTENFCPQGPNYTHYSNKAYDALYKKAMAAMDDSIRYRLYGEMDRLMMDDAPVVILYYDEVLRFTRKSVVGLGSNAMNLLTLKKVRKL